MASMSCARKTCCRLSNARPASSLWIKSGLSSMILWRRWCFSDDCQRGTRCKLCTQDACLPSSLHFAQHSSTLKTVNMLSFVVGSFILINPARDKFVSPGAGLGFSRKKTRFPWGASMSVTSHSCRSLSPMLVSRSPTETYDRCIAKEPPFHRKNLGHSTHTLPRGLCRRPCPWLC